MSEEHKARTREMIKVMQAYVDGQEIEVRPQGVTDDFVKHIEWEYMDGVEPSWSWFTMNYRIATTPDSIDWSHVAPEWKWMARDENGDLYFFNEEPSHTETVWIAEYAIEASGFASYKRGTVDWKDSLVMRPET